MPSIDVITSDSLTFQTSNEYWDCECNYNYIHKKTDRTICAHCGTIEEDQPDSRMGEVITMLVLDKIDRSIRDA